MYEITYTDRNNEAQSLIAHLNDLYTPEYLEHFGNTFNLETEIRKDYGPSAHAKNVGDAYHIVVSGYPAGEAHHRELHFVYGNMTKDAAIALCNIDTQSDNEWIYGPRVYTHKNIVGAAEWAVYQGYKGHNSIPHVEFHGLNDETIRDMELRVERFCETA